LIKPIINHQNILKALSFEWRDINYTIKKLGIIDPLDIQHLKNKLKEFERKKLGTKIIVDNEEYWKKC